MSAPAAPRSASEAGNGRALLPGDDARQAEAFRRHFIYGSLSGAWLCETCRRYQWNDRVKPEEAARPRTYRASRDRLPASLPRPWLSAGFKRRRRERMAGMIFDGPAGEPLIAWADALKRLDSDSGLSILRMNGGRFLVRVSDVRGRDCSYEILARILDGQAPDAGHRSSKPN
jgi:hypothetical protein